MRGNGRKGNLTSTVPEIPTYELGFNNQEAVFSPNVEQSGFAGKIIANDRELDSMLKALFIRDEKYAMTIVRALWSCAEFDNQEGIDALRNLVSALCSVSGRYIHLAAEVASGMLTTTTNWKDLGAAWARERERRQSGSGDSLSTARRPKI
jgi:hypothetical protein